MVGRHRYFIILVALGLLAAACSGGGGGGADGSEAASGAPAEEVVETVMEPDPDDPGENIELEFWTFVPNHADFMIAQAEAFNAQNDQFNILLNATSSDFEAMHDRLLVALQSGVGGPDIVDIEIQRFATFLRGQVPLHPLNDVVDEYRADLVEERLAPYQADGVEYGIDYHLGAFVMYYNTEIMEEAGVDPDSIETWDDYVEAGRQVVENTDALMTVVETQSRFSVLGPMLQNGGGTYNENNELILDSPENAEAVQMVADMVTEHEIAEPPTNGNVHDPGFFAAFNEGQYASIWMPQWYMIRFKDQMPDTEGKLLVRPLPVFEEGGNVSTMGGGTGTAITNQIDDAHVEVAKEFLGFAKLTYDAQVKIWTDLGFDPFRNDVYEDPALAEPDPWFSDEPVMANLVEMFDNLAPEYTGPRYPEAIQQLNENVAFRVVEEGVPAEEALAQAAEEVRAVDN
jgi:arabinosaccharide transport system substrate-binding protein